MRGCIGPQVPVMLVKFVAYNCVKSARGNMQLRGRRKFQFSRVEDEEDDDDGPRKQQGGEGEKIGEKIGRRKMMGRERDRNFRLG